MIPLKITAVMGSEVVVLDGIPTFDGIVAMGVFRQMTQKQQDALPDIRVTEWADDLDLPLERWTMDAPRLEGADPRLFDADGKLWGWKASIGIAPVSARSRLDIRQPIPYAEFRDLNDKPVMNFKAGKFKPHDIALPTILAREISWYAVGDLKGVTLAVNQITAIGKKRTVGKGRVLEWRIDEHDGGDSWRNRWMPAPDGVGTWKGVRAPYWRPERKYPCVF